MHPAGRRAAALELVDNRYLLLHGGYSGSQQLLHDTWVFDTHSNRWLMVDVTGTESYWMHWTGTVQASCDIHEQLHVKYIEACHPAAAIACSSHLLARSAWFIGLLSPATLDQLKYTVLSYAWVMSCSSRL